MTNPHADASPMPPPGWPRPPFDWPHREQARTTGGAWACGLETVEGRSLQAFARDIDPREREWLVGPRAGGPFVALPLARLARITLDAPLQGLGPLPVAALERDYSVQTPDGRDLLQGRTLGHVETPQGWFLFAAQPGHVALSRVLVPRAANLTCKFAPGPDEAMRWVTDLASLRTAMAAPRGKRIPRMGEALVQLGFVTASQIEEVLARPASRGRLGERLLQQRLLTPEQLEIGLAFKLGFPLVDLAQFPVDPACMRLLSPELVRRHGALPIWREGRQVVVAMDRPITAATLDAATLWPGLAMTPVFATRGAILRALATHRNDDAWSQESPWR
jgi:hypothetical protein